MHIHKETARLHKKILPAVICGVTERLSTVFFIFYFFLIFEPCECIDIFKIRFLKVQSIISTFCIVLKRSILQSGNKIKQQQQQKTYPLYLKTEGQSFSLTIRHIILNLHLTGSSHTVSPGSSQTYEYKIQKRLASLLSCGHGTVMRTRLWWLTLIKQSNPLLNQPSADTFPSHFWETSSFVLALTLMYTTKWHYFLTL